MKNGAWEIARGPAAVKARSSGVGLRVTDTVRSADETELRRRLPVATGRIVFCR